MAPTEESTRRRAYSTPALRSRAPVHGLSRRAFVSLPRPSHHTWSRRFLGPAVTVHVPGAGWPGLGMTGGRLRLLPMESARAPHQNCHSEGGAAPAWPLRRPMAPTEESTRRRAYSAPAPRSRAPVHGLRTRAFVPLPRPSLRASSRRFLGPAVTGARSRCGLAGPRNDRRQPSVAPPDPIRAPPHNLSFRRRRRVSLAPATSHGADVFALAP
jgi:hypothetical protein